MQRQSFVDQRADLHGPLLRCPARADFLQKSIYTAAEVVSNILYNSLDKVEDGHISVRKLQNHELSLRRRL
jgi:hypothetical protein